MFGEPRHTKGRTWGQPFLKRRAATSYTNPGGWSLAGVEAVTEAPNVDAHVRARGADVTVDRKGNREPESKGWPATGRLALSILFVQFGNGEAPPWRYLCWVVAAYNALIVLWQLERRTLGRLLRRCRWAAGRVADRLRR